MVQAGIIGNGFIGPVRIEVLRRLGGVNMMVLCDSSLTVTQEHADVPHTPHTYDGVETLLAHPGLQVMYNCTLDRLYIGINRQILHAGLHVFSERPLRMTPNEARELETLAQQAEVVHSVSFVYRQSAMVQQAVNVARSGSAGGLSAIRGSHLQDWMLLETDHNWRVDVAQGGDSRAVADIGLHWCDMVQFVTGKRIVEVMVDLIIVWPVHKASIASNITFGQ